MDLEYKSIKTASGVTGYVQVGEHKQALILVVGYSGTIYHWNRNFVYELSKNYSVYLIDNRLVGMSVSSNQNSLFGMANDIIDFIEAIGLTKPILAGWSFGGACVLEVLKIRAKLVKCAILFSTVPHPSYLSKDFDDIIYSELNIGSEELRNKMHYLFFSKPFNVDERIGIIQSLLPIRNYPYRFTAEARELQNSIVEFWRNNPLDGDRLASIKDSVLILWAEDDLVVHQDLFEVWEKYLPNLKKIIYKSGGHFLLHERGIEVARDIDSFCKESSKLKLSNQ